MGKRQYKMRNNTQNNTKTENSQNKQQNSKTKTSTKRILKNTSTVIREYQREANNVEVNIL